MTAKLHRYCLLCGRELKNEDTRKLGYGPVCYKKFLLMKNAKRLFKVGVSNGLSL